MFRRSGPVHMLLHTDQNKMVQNQISLSLTKVKVKFGTKGHMWRSSKGKNWAPPGRLRSLSSIVLVAPPCRVKTPPWPSPPETRAMVAKAASWSWSGGGGQDRGHLPPGEQDCEDADPSPHQAGHGGCGPLVSRLPLVPLAVTLRRLLLAASWYLCLVYIRP